MKFPLASSVELEFFRQLWQKSNDPFWLCECVADDFVLIAINPAERSLDSRFRPGVSVREILGHGPDADALMTGYYECRDSGRTVSYRQQPFLHGEERLFQTLLVPVTDEHGKVTHICGTASDLTGFLQTQRAQEELNRQLELRVAERTQALNQANAELREANLVLEKLASSDSLTELANRRRFFEQATGEVIRAQRYGHPLSLQMLDIDHFKTINDRFGHAAGDGVLKAFADTLRANLRHNDLAARIGGEEFVILLPETGIDDAMLHAERTRRAVEASAIPFARETLRVTVSIGVATLDAGEMSADAMLMRADSGLYRAKQGGRNRVQVDWGAQANHSLWPL
jgi:diguanylate cyclase (GGDEF)-like protein